jgi:hypothetical protein
VPLRKLDYFQDYAILRDHNRKIEVLIDHQLLPLRWDPTWSRWRNLISATVQISADFVHTGHYRKRGGEWKLIESETALPSRTELTVPDGLEEEILKARTAHTRFGQYWKQIDRLRAHVEEIPTERDEPRRLCWNQGLPGDFDVAQINWRPDYDAYYHEHLCKRALTMYAFRNEYIFDLEKSVVVEGAASRPRYLCLQRPPRCQALGSVTIGYMSIAEVDKAIEKPEPGPGIAGSESVARASCRLAPRGLPMPKTQVHQRYGAPMLT